MLSPFHSLKNGSHHREYEKYQHDAIKMFYYDVHHVRKSTTAMPKAKRPEHFEQ